MLAGCGTIQYDDGYYETPDFILSGEYGGVVGSGYLARAKLEFPIDEFSYSEERIPSGSYAKLEYGTLIFGLGAIDGDGFRDEGDGPISEPVTDDVITTGYLIDLGYRRRFGASNSTTLGGFDIPYANLYYGAGVSLWAMDTDYPYSASVTENVTENEVGVYGEVGLDWINVRLDSVGGLILTAGFVTGF